MTDASRGGKLRSSFWVAVAIFLVGGAGLIQLALIPVVTNAINATLEERRNGIYPTIIGVEGTILGFVLAALTIVLGYSQKGRFKLLHASRHWRAVFLSYTNTLRWTSVAIIVAILALIFDQDRSPSPRFAILFCWSVIFTSYFVGRMLWVTEQIVNLIVNQRQREPGQ